MRLTDKNGARKIAIHRMYPTKKETAEKYQENQRECEMYNKLADLEDIEEELGIDLITLVKASKSKVFVKFTNSFHDLKDFNLDIENKRFIQKYINWDFELKFKDYGKTWALTKEELE